MVYVNELRHLNLKSAELESSTIVRELKEKTPYPLTNEKLQGQVAELLLSETDKETMLHAFHLVQPTIEEVMSLLTDQTSLYEQVNLQRALTMLNELLVPLKKNIDYADEIVAWQENWIQQTIPVLNGIPRSKTAEEKNAWNRHFSDFFEKILRNSEFGFNYHDIINEAHLDHIRGLDEGMSKGFLLHITLEEELKKVNYETLKARLPPETVQFLEHVRGNIEIIKRGVERAYQGNMRMVQWTLMMYAYVKWLTNPWEKFR